MILICSYSATNSQVCVPVALYEYKDPPFPDCPYGYTGNFPDGGLQTLLSMKIFCEDRYASCLYPFCSYSFYGELMQSKLRISYRFCNKNRLTACVGKWLVIKSIQIVSLLISYKCKLWMQEPVQDVFLIEYSNMSRLNALGIKVPNKSLSRLLQKKSPY